MKIDIEIFRILNDIAVRNKITTYEWADLSGMAQSRVVEFRTLAKARLANPNAKTGREFTDDKCFDLFKGLQKRLGVEMVQKELAKEIEQETDRKRKFFLMGMILSSLSEKSQDEAEKTLLGIIKNDKK